MNRLNKMLYISVIGLLAATTAEARRNERDGFNFGAGVRVLSNSDQTAGTAATNNEDSKTMAASQAISPRVGFAFYDYFNLGLSGYFETQSSDQTFSSKDGSQKIERVSNSTTRSASLFARFMFAKYMHFEGGFGIYDRRIATTDTYTNKDSSGKFKGETESNTLHGMGPGYHLGFGVELPITSGFYFSSDFILRAAQLRDYQGSGSIGKKRSRMETREVVFGLAHYIN